MAVKCKVCGQVLTDPVSQRRGMGDQCAARHLQLAASTDDELLAGLEQLLRESPKSAAVQQVIEEVRSIRFRVPEQATELLRIIDWHVTTGHRYVPIPSPLYGVATVIIGFIEGRYHMMNGLRMRGYQVESRRDALRLLADLAVVVPEVLAVVDVQLQAEESRKAIRPA